MNRDTERELNRLRHALAQAAADMQYIARWRKEAHDYDSDVGHTDRDFSDAEEWESVEQFAANAARCAALSAGKAPLKMKASSPNVTGEPRP